jgi:PPP family 3-phenylpropionic acid transporter
MKIVNLNPFRSVALALGLFYLFYFAMVGVYVIFMPKVLKDIGYSSVEIGAIYTSAPLMRFLLPFIFKRWIKLNHKVFFISLGATFLTTLVFFITINNFWLLLISSLIYGGAMGAALPFVETIAIEQIGKERYGKIRLWGSVGFSLVAFVLGNILNGYIIALTSLSLMALFTMVFGFVLAKFDKDNAKEQIIEDNRGFSLKKYWAFWASIFLFQFSFGGFYNFFTIYETSYGVPLDIVSYLWIFGVVCEIVMLIFQGPLLANFDLITLLLVSTLSGVLRWLMVAFFPDNLAIIMLSQATHALSFALYYTAAISYVYRLYSQKRLAQQFFLGISFGLGGAVGAIVSGIIYKITPSGLFIFEAFIAFISAILLIVHKKRKEFIA